MSKSPRRAYPENTPMAELRTAELFAVVGLRLWAAGYRDTNDDGSLWQSVFAAAKIGTDGMTAFNALLLIVATAAQRSLDVRCTKCPSLGADEGWFLQLIGLVQRDCITGAELVLMGWLPPAAARTALPFAIVLAETMAERDLKIPHRPDETALSRRFEHGDSWRSHYESGSLALIH
jgi:hypothetical protein